MKICDEICCEHFPCSDVNHHGFRIPDFELNPDNVKIVLISEAAAARIEDNYYMPGDPLFHQTTLLAFKDGGAAVSSFQDILEMGVYMTTAVKCAKLSYGIQTTTIVECSRLLEKELSLFSGLKALLLMGDAAIKGLNTIAKRKGLSRIVPAGSTYKIRRGDYRFQGIPVFPSYLQAGPSFFIEKIKRKMIAEDIASALQLVSH